MVIRNTGFVGKEDISKLDEVIRRNRAFSFGSKGGSRLSPRELEAVSTAILSSGAEKAIASERIAGERKDRALALAQSESQFARNLELSEEQFGRTEALRREEFTRNEAFRLSEQERLEEAAGSERTVALFRGIGELMFAPISSGGGGGFTTIASKVPGVLRGVGNVIKKIFGF